MYGGYVRTLVISIQSGDATAGNIPCCQQLDCGCVSRAPFKHSLLGGDTNQSGENSFNSFQKRPQSSMYYAVVLREFASEGSGMLISTKIS